MDKSKMIGKVKNALLGMQRYSWEQGVAAQAFLEMGETELVVVMAKEAVVRQIADGRLGVIGGLTAVTDPAVNGEPLLYASKITKDTVMESAFNKMIHWLLNSAPKTKDGILYHLTDKPQVWVDSFYMAPPCLAAAGYYDEAIKQINGFRSILCDPQKNLYSHIWDDSLNNFVRKDFWGVGNGWALSGITRVIRSIPVTMTNEKNKLIEYVKEGMDACLTYLREDGLFHDVIDNTDSFVETNLSQMLAYTLYRGMAGGWLDSGYLKYAEKMRQAACNKVDKYGLVQGVCASPDFDRPGTASEGQAFFLLMESAADEFYSLQKPSSCAPIDQLTIEIKNKYNTILSRVSGQEKVSLVYKQNYEAGDKICFSVTSQSKYLVIKIDDILGESLVYVPEGILDYFIPLDEEAVAYSPNAFKGYEHIIRMCIAKKEEIYSYRNLAQNIIDQRGSTTYYPHVTANFETRNEAIFAARNTIDGIKDNCGHGVWPYQSWGTGERPDSELMLDFGREVEVDKIVLYLRADFPHDTYWNAITILFSDGFKKTVQLEKTADPQYIEFDKKRVCWVKLMDLKMADETSDFAALRQLEIYGCDFEDTSLS